MSKNVWFPDLENKRTGLALTVSQETFIIVI